MRNDLMTICKQDLTKQNTTDLHFYFKKDERYFFDIINIGNGNYCTFFYNKVYDQKCKIFESEFREYFYTENELRKIKLNKIKNKK